ncbi:MAG: hypothetical protein EKK46_08255 [Rhodocyclaceae bacterium]|nr:MAG: hypothetical protein EKK46_08255 [Rhodocyclaceae bacterium]
MNFPDHLFPAGWGLPTNGLFLAVLLAALWLAPWKRLMNSTQSNVWAGSIVVLCLMWSLRAGVQPGLNLHLLGATALTLMFGRSLALIGLTLVLAAVTFNRGGGWEYFGLSALLTIACPVLVAEAVRKLVERHLPANFFVYVFFSAFFGAALTVLAVGLLSTLTVWLAGLYTLDKLLADYLPYYLLLGFAEAWLNGAIITLMVVYAPHWVGTFDDRRYLWKK